MRISDWSSDVCSSDLPEIHIRLPMFPFRSTRSIALEAWAPFIIFVRPIGLRIAKIRFSSRTNADERRIAPSLRTTTCWVSVFIPAQELVPHLDKDASGKRGLRSAERRVGQASVRTFISRWSQYPYKNKKH